MNKISIVHFQPLEKYPPVTNLIRFLVMETKHPDELQIISTHPGKGKPLFHMNGVVIHRVATWKASMSRVQRLLLYLQFNLKALLLLCTKRPGKVLYYETLSAGAPLMYKEWFNKQVELYIHYHEYTSPAEYLQGMVLNRWLHNLEKKIYKKTTWVSHTNEYRSDLFKKDLGDYAPEQVKSLPNYPPASWKDAFTRKTVTDSRTGFVYVGALSMETMYVKEFAGYIKENPTNCFWHIYSDNFSPDVLQFIREINAPGISFKGAVEYDALPGLLPHYDIGIILYKGHIPNYIYNAPNKLFEYLACGLDVWFPKEMVGSTPYIRTGTHPEVRPVDFHKLPDLKSMSQARDHDSLYETDFFAEASLRPLVQRLFSDGR